MANKQLALGLVLRFTDSGSSAARSALDGVGRALDGVSGAGARAAESAGNARRAIIGVGDASTVVNRTTTASAGALVVWAGRAKAADTAATSAARGITQVSTASNVASRSVAAITTQVQAATRALERLHSVATLTAAGVGGGGGNWGGGPLLLGGPSGGGARRQMADVADAVIINRKPASTTSAGSRAEALLNGGRGVMAIGAGYTAGKMVLAPPITQTMDYERQLAQVALTAAEKGASAADVAALSRKLNAGIMAAIRPNEGGGGGSRASALVGLNTLIASGYYKNVDEALADLKWVQKGATAFGADPADIAATILAGKQMGVGSQRALEMAGASGKDGSFEVRNMAKFLPSWMPGALRAGLKGEAGYAALLTMGQAAMLTAGSADQAGTNMKSGLAKIMSPDTIADAKKHGINLIGSLADAAKHGVMLPDAFADIMQHVMKNDPNYKKALAQVRSAKNEPEKAAAYAAMADVYKSNGFTSLIQDMEAGAVWTGFFAQRDAPADRSTRTLRANAINSGGLVDENMNYISTLPGFKAEVFTAEKENAAQNFMDTNVNPALGKMADWLSTMARDYPTFTAGVWGATTALTALAAVAGAASLAQVLGGGGGGVFGRLAGAAGPALGLLAKGLGLEAAWETGQYLGGKIDTAIDGTDAKENIGEFMAKLVYRISSVTPESWGWGKDAEQALDFHAAAKEIREAAQLSKDAAAALKEYKPTVYLDPANLDRELQQYQTFDARRR